MWFLLPETKWGFFRYSKLDSEVEKNIDDEDEYEDIDIDNLFNIISYEQRIKDIFVYTGNKDDKLHVKDLRKIFQKMISI